MNTRDYLNEAVKNRILILDGAMGMLIYSWRKPNGELLSDSDYLGERFASHPFPVRGCTDLICLSKPEIISAIHEGYLKAGADIIETCSINSSTAGLSGFGLERYAYELSFASAQIAKKAAHKYDTPEKKRLVAGSIGPTSKNACLTPDPDDPLTRQISWDELVPSYYENARGLLDGGADILLIETVVDTLNAKAAQFAVKRLLSERGTDIPVIVSATVNESGHLLGGQELKAFATSVMPLDPWAIGINCSFGAEKMKPYLTELASFAPCPVIAYPNAGFPDQNGNYSDTPEIMADRMEEWMEKGLVNIAGGCCGSTPLHIKAIASKAQNYRPRVIPGADMKKNYLAGNSLFGIETGKLSSLKEAASTAEFLAFVCKGDYESALQEAIEEIVKGAEILFLRPDTFPDPVNAVRSLIFLSYCFRESARVPIGIECTNPEITEAALKCIQGRCLVKCGGNAEILNLAKNYGAVYIE